MNLRSFKLYRVYLNPLNLSNVRGWILTGLYPASKRESNIRRRMFTYSIKRGVGRFHVVVVLWTSKKCTKKRYARAELLFFSKNQLSFFMLSLSWSLKFPQIWLVGDSQAWKFRNRTEQSTWITAASHRFLPPGSLHSQGSPLQVGRVGESPDNKGKRWGVVLLFQFPHNTPCLPPPQQFCKNYYFCLWEDCIFQRDFE